MQKRIVLFVVMSGTILVGCDTSVLQRLVQSSLGVATPRPDAVPSRNHGEPTVSPTPGFVPITFVIDPTPRPTAIPAATPAPTLSASPTPQPSATTTPAPTPTPTPEWHGAPVPPGEYIPPVLDMEGVWEQFTFENDQKTVAQKATVKFEGNSHPDSTYMIEWGEFSAKTDLADQLDGFYSGTYWYRNGYLEGKVVCVTASGSHRVRRVCGTLHKSISTYIPSDWTVADDPPYVPQK